jgi:hypothetical protein
VLILALQGSLKASTCYAWGEVDGQVDADAGRLGAIEGDSSIRILDATPRSAPFGVEEHWQWLSPEV